MPKGKVIEHRTRKFSLTSYHDEETLLRTLSERPARAAVYIYHDKDVDDEGVLKPPHYHILLCTYNAATVGQVRRWFPNNQNTLGQILKDDEGAEAYLTHSDNPEKYQYSADDIMYYGEGIEPFRRAAVSSGRTAETCEDILQDIIDGVSLRSLARRYGRDIIINYKAYTTYAQMMLSQERSVKYDALDEWQVIANLHEKGVLSEYEYYRLRSEYGEGESALCHIKR